MELYVFILKARDIEVPALPNRARYLGAEQVVVAGAANFVPEQGVERFAELFGHGLPLDDVLPLLVDRGGGDLATCG
jgi:hypothetical protein